MIQLAVITDEIDNDIEKALDVMAEYGIVHAEIRTVGDKNISVMTADEVDALRSLLDRRGVRAIGVASPVYKTDLPNTGSGATGALHGASMVDFADQLDLLSRCIATANRLGAPYVRTFTFWKHGALTPDVEERIVDAYAEPAKMAASSGVVLLVENEHGCYTGTGAEAARVVSQIDSPAVKIVWDPGNAIFAGERPFPSGYEAVKPFMAHVHVKDARPVGENGVEVEWVPVGEGLAKWPEQIKALKADGYDGFLSLETHYTLGGDKAAASRQSLDVLKRILAET